MNMNIKFPNIIAQKLTNKFLIGLENHHHPQIAVKHRTAARKSGCPMQQRSVHSDITHARVHRTHQPNRQTANCIVEEKKKKTHQNTPATHSLSHSLLCCCMAYGRCIYTTNKQTEREYKPFFEKAQCVARCLCECQTKQNTCRENSLYLAELIVCSLEYIYSGTASVCDFRHNFTCKKSTQ